jgi:hypothetical protein
LGGAGLRPKAPGETEHRHRACGLSGVCRCSFLPLQPDQQLPGTCFVQLFHLFYDHFDCAHVGSVAPTGNVANAAFWKLNINTLVVIEGDMCRRARLLVFEWAALHRDELRQAWDLASRNQEPSRIQPLE